MTPDVSSLRQTGGVMDSDPSGSNRHVQRKSSIWLSLKIKEKWNILTCLSCSDLYRCATKSTLWGGVQSSQDREQNVFFKFFIQIRRTQGEWRRYETHRNNRSFTGGIRRRKHTKIKAWTLSHTAWMFHPGFSIDSFLQIKNGRKCWKVPHTHTHTTPPRTHHTTKHLRSFNPAIPAVFQ